MASYKKNRKGQARKYDIWPDFSFDKFAERRMLGPFEQVLVYKDLRLVYKVLKRSEACQMEVESSWNLIKLLPDFHSTFPLFSKKLGRVETLHPTFVRHLPGIRSRIKVKTGAIRRQTK